VTAAETASRQLKFRDPVRARGLAAALATAVDGALAATQSDRLAIMHVCGSHEQAIAKFGLRSLVPPALDVIMGPGCPVCVTDMPEIDEAVALADAGVTVATYGDMYRVRGSGRSLSDAHADGARVEVVYSVSQAVDLARGSTHEVVFFACGFETTAVTTAAALLAGVPANFSVLSAHKYVLPAMDVVARLPDSRIAAFLAAGHAATITGSAIFEPFAREHGIPVVVAGFEPLDVLAALVKAAEAIRDGEATVFNMFPRCVTEAGNRAAQARLWEVFACETGGWRGIADVPAGNIRLRERWRAHDARYRFASVAAASGPAPQEPAGCICGTIMIGRANPTACALFKTTCTPQDPVGACMVSSEGTCRIWHEYGGVPILEAAR
jgi:hydrogenase expression/formation protein HypD